VARSVFVSFLLVFHRALPDLQRMKHKPDQAFGHREVFCFFLEKRSDRSNLIYPTSAYAGSKRLSAEIREDGRTAYRCSWPHFSQIKISLSESKVNFADRCNLKRSLPRLGRRFGEVGPVDFSGHRNRGSIQGFDES